MAGHAAISLQAHYIFIGGRKPKKGIHAMADQAQVTPQNPPPAGDEESLRNQLALMWGAFVKSPVRNSLFSLGVAMVVTVMTTGYGQVQLNRWNRPFYDALERRDLKEFLHQLAVFAVIAIFLLLLNVAQTWL